ncbi:MAG: zf-TFIIB domain-containing protein [Candidatus Woesebacteria bacterium]|jgi:Zn-finger nucleic acid-binding protein
MQPYGGYAQNTGYQPAQQQLVCPRCRCFMTEVTEPESGVKIDVCTNHQCGAYFFDFREFQATVNAILRATGFAAQQIPVPQALGQAQQLLAEVFGILHSRGPRRSVICPRCNGQMYETKENGVEVDTCHNCWGMFFDGGEFQQVFAYIASRRGFSLGLANPNVNQYRHQGHNRSFLDMLLGRY